MKVSVSVSIFGSAWYQYQYQYRNFRPAEYQYRIGIEFVDQESISIVSVSEKLVSKGSVVGDQLVLLLAAPSVALVDWYNLEIICSP